jgi:hypothetical protein
LVHGEGALGLHRLQQQQLSGVGIHVVLFWLKVVLATLKRKTKNLPRVVTEKKET